MTAEAELEGWVTNGIITGGWWWYSTAECGTRRRSHKLMEVNR